MSNNNEENEAKSLVENENETEVMTVTLELDEGDVECTVFAIFDCGSQEYIALQPLDENGENTNGEVWLYGYSENPDDPNEEPELRYIEDDDEYERVEDRFDEYLDERDFDEIMDESEDAPGNYLE